MKNTSVRFGIIASIAFILWVCIEHALGYNTTKMEVGQYTRLASAYLFWLFIIITIIVKKKESGGSISFAQSMKTALLMIIVYSFITAIWLAIYQHFINPDFYSFLRKFSIDQFKAERKSELEITRALKEIDMMYNGSAFSFFMYFVFSTIAGSVIAFIASLIIRSRHKFSQQ